MRRQARGELTSQPIDTATPTPPSMHPPKQKPRSPVALRAAARGSFVRTHGRAGGLCACSRKNSVVCKPYYSLLLLILPAGLRGPADPQFNASFSHVYTAPSLQVPWHAVLGK